MAKGIDLTALVAAAKARTGKPGTDLKGKAPLTDATVQTRAPAFAADGSEDATRTVDLTATAKASADATIETPVAQIQAPFMESASAQTDAPPKVAHPAPPTQTQEMRAFPSSEEVQAETSSTSSDGASVHQTSAPAEESASESAGPTEKPRTLDEAIRKIDDLHALIGNLFELVVGAMPLDAVKKIIPAIRASGGLVSIVDDATTLLVGADAENVLAPYAQGVRDGAASILDEMNFQSPDHVEILRTAVISLLLDPDLDSDDVKMLAETRGADHVKQVIAGLADDPSIIRSILIKDAAAKSGIEPSQVTDPKDDDVAKQAAQWVETETVRFTEAAKTCIDSWAQIIGGD